MGYVPEDRDVFSALTVDENLRLAERDAEPQYDLVYDLFPELSERGKQARRHALRRPAADARDRRALLNENRVLLVDEPTKGLSPLLVTEVAMVLERVSELTTVLLVEQNLGVVQRVARDAVVLDTGRVVHIGPAQGAARRQADDRIGMLGVAMSTFLLLTITGLGLGAMYFLVASGLSLIYGLMGVLNFAHGVVHHRRRGTRSGSPSRSSAVCSVLPAVPGRRARGSDRRYGVRRARGAGADSPAVRPPHRAGARHRRPRTGVTALVTAIWGSDARVVAAPTWVGETTTIFGANIPNDRWLEIATAVIVLFALETFLRRTRYGLIIRAGVENRAMVTALGIDVRKAFTLVFAIGGLAAGIAAVLYTLYSTTVDPQQGTSLVIFAFIVVVIGGLGSIRGTLWAAVLVGLVQQYANYYASSGLGDLSVVLLLGIVLIARPRGLSGSFA